MSSTSRSRLCSCFRSMWASTVQFIVSQDESVKRRRRLLLGIVVLLLVDVLWVGSSELTDFIFKYEGFDKPFFTTFFKTSSFMIYLTGFLFYEPWRLQCIACLKNETSSNVVVSAVNQDSEHTSLLNSPSSSGETTPIPRQLMNEPTFEEMTDEDISTSRSAEVASSSFEIIARPRRVTFSSVREVRQLSDHNSEQARLTRLPYHLGEDQKLPVHRVARVALLFCLLWFCANLQLSGSHRKHVTSSSKYFVILIRYPRLLMELSVEVYRMRYDAYEMRPHRQLDLRGVRLQINERTRPHSCQDGTRYSVEETNQFHGQAQEDERVGTFSLPRQITVSRSSPPEPMSSLGQNSGGKYIWKIVGFSHHIQDARNGKITSLESPPIYTSQQEYKFSMHFFPKGINGGDGRHFGLFVGMMQGEYDTILEWPFCGRISLTIMGQSTDVNGCRHDISGTFIAKRDLRAFQKPTAAGPYSTLYGYAEFAPTDLVCSPQYLKDDTVMIQIEIHKNI